MAQRVEQALQYAPAPKLEARVTPRSPWEAQGPTSTPRDGSDAQAETPAAAPAATTTPGLPGLPTSPRDPAVRAAFTQGGTQGRAQAPSGVRSFTIPDLYCPFDPAVHPQAAVVHAGTIAWAKAMGLARDEKHVQALHKAKVGWLVARAFPIADKMPALQIAADWITLFCLIDNHIESIRGPALSHVYLKSLLDVFREGAAPKIIDPYAQAFADLRLRMIDVDVPFWITRFGEQLARLFGTFVDEAKYRQLEAVPEAAKYRKMREVSSGLYFGFRLGELTDNINLPPHVRDDPTVRNLESKASLIVGLANDIYTVEKELAKGEVNNMVMVLMHEEGLTIDEALTRTVELHDAETHEFIALTRRLPKFSREIDADLQRYVEVLSSMISGHRSWALETSRYTPGTADAHGRIEDR
ncbi:MAG TPA: hypothetical protein VGB85_23930 [Nannocystis sp.]